MTRERNIPWEMLAEVTGTDWVAGKGELAAGLASIRAQWQGEDGELPEEIRERARLYRRLFPGISLTPTALAKHWKRVYEEAHQRSAEATNQSQPYRECGTCGGHGFVVCGTRPMAETMWMKEHDFKSRGLIDEYAACPDCSSVDASFRRYDGTWARVPDADRVRTLMAS